MLEVSRTIPAAGLRLLVFDLDGTLIDSRIDLGNSVNAMLAAFDRPALPLPVIASYIGDGASMLVRRSLGDPEDSTLVEAALEIFLTHYRAHLMDTTYVYPGVFEALDAIRAATAAAATAMAVLSNKPVGPSQRLCDALGLSSYFFRVYGGNSFSTKKPDPQGLKALIREAGVTPEQTLMIGDSDIDVLTARSAGAWALGCRFGLAPHTLLDAEADALVDTPLDWTDVFTAKKVIAL